MTTFNEQLKKHADSIRMRSSEKRELRGRIVAYMEYHPLPEEVRKKSTKHAVKTPYMNAIPSESFFAFRLGTRQFQSMAVLGALLFVVGVPTLAERSLPGDILYPMKVMVNEEVRSTLAFSPYAKVEWEAARLERRLSEARLLAQEGRLTEDAERKVAEAVKEHSNAAQETILALRQTDTEEAALAEIAFASVLDAQADIITLHEEQARLESDGEGDVSGAVLASAVRDARSVAASAREESRVTPERLFALLERETTYAAELFESIEDETTDKEAESIARRLGDIGRKVAQAQDLQQSILAMSATPAQADEGIVTGSSTEGDAATATLALEAAPAVANVADVASILRNALTDTRKLISFMTDIEVRQSVDVERLIPITLTDQERESAVYALIKHARDSQTYVQNHIPDPALATKVDAGLELLAVAIEQSESSLREKRLEDAEAAAAEAAALADDLRAMVVDSPERPPEANSSSTSTSTPTSTPAVEGAATSTTSTPPAV